MTKKREAKLRGPKVMTMQKININTGKLDTIAFSAILESEKALTENRLNVCDYILMRFRIINSHLKNLLQCNSWVSLYSFGLQSVG